MLEDLTVHEQNTGATQAAPRAWRELDVVAAEAELRLRLPQVQSTLDDIEKAKVVTQQTLQYKFSI